MRDLSKKIRDIRSLTGLNQIEFGRVVGNYGKAQHSEDNAVPQSTISKWERGAQKPTPEYVTQLAGIAGVSVEEFLGLQIVERPTAGRTIRVVGQLAAGDWREAVMWPEEDQYEVPAPLPRGMRDIELVGYEVSGESMNRVYPNGSIVYVEPIAVSGRMPKSGERVVVQRVDSAGLYEASLKEYVADDSGRVWLWPRSDSPEHQAPIEYRDKKRNVEVSILGIVRFALLAESIR